MKRSQGRWWIDSNYPPAMIGAPGIMTTDEQYNIFFNDLLSCVLQTVIFDGLPESIDPTYFKLCLFLAGRVAVFRDTRGGGELRALDCATAGAPDVYYMPEQILIVNPTFNGYSYTLTPGKDCAVIFCRECDRYNYGRQTGGIFGLISSTAQLLADITISISVATKNMRLVNIMSANDENTVKSIDEAVQRMYNGEPYITVTANLVDKLEALPITAQTNTQQLMQLIQTRQYIYAHFYEQIGLKTHDQMKKERLITSEIDEGAELAVFNLADMLAEIQRGIDEANRIFGTEITMQLNPLIAETLQPAEPDPEQPQPEPAAMEATAAAPDPVTAAAPDPEPAPAPEPEPDPEPATVDAQTDGSETPETEEPEKQAESEKTDTEISIEITENSGNIEINIEDPSPDPEETAEEPAEEPPEGGAE